MVVTLADKSIISLGLDHVGSTYNSPSCKFLFPHRAANAWRGAVYHLYPTLILTTNHGSNHEQERTSLEATSRLVTLVLSVPMY